MIEVDHLTKEFSRFVAVSDLSFTVERGEVLGFLGPNGAGKSTTMKMLTGFLTPSAGHVSIAGIDIAKDPLPAQSHIGYLPEGAPAWGDMTPRGFLHFIAQIRMMPTPQKSIDYAVDLLELHAVLDQPIDTLSKGFCRRVGLAQAVMHDPPILIMDEPTDGLDPNQKYHVRRAITEMAQEKAIIISTHILEEVNELCTRALIINHGELVANGTPSELMAQSTYHNAVHLTVVSAQATQIKAALGTVVPDEHIEITMRDKETVFTLLPQNGGQNLLAQVTALAREHEWQVQGLALDQGRLDDLFRKLTRAHMREQE